MPKYTVQSPLAHDGERYAPHDEIELTEQAAAALPAGTVAPVRAAANASAPADDAKPAKAGKTSK